MKIANSKTILMCGILSFTWMDIYSIAQADSPYSAPGTVTEQGKGVTGSIGSDGTIYKQGQGVAGNVGANGTITGQGRGVVGSISPDGTIYRQGQGVAGHVSSNGTIYGQGGGVLGSVSPDGTVYAQGKGVVGHVPPGNPAVAFGMLSGQGGGYRHYDITKTKKFQEEERQVDLEESWRVCDEGKGSLIGGGNGNQILGFINSLGKVEDLHGRKTSYFLKGNLIVNAKAKNKPVAFLNGMNTFLGVRTRYRNGKWITDKTDESLGWYLQDAYKIENDHGYFIGYFEPKGDVWDLYQKSPRDLQSSPVVIHNNRIAFNPQNCKIRSKAKALLLANEPALADLRPTSSLDKDIWPLK